jgi:mRNA interferase HigB
VRCSIDDRHWLGCGRELFANHAGHRGIKAARSQFDAWLDIVTRAEWRNPEDVKASYPKASILKAGRVVFNIKDNDYRLIARVQQASVVMIRFFGTHGEYDEMTFDRKTYRLRINGRAGIRRDAEARSGSPRSRKRMAWGPSPDCT